MINLLSYIPLIHVEGLKYVVFLGMVAILGFLVRSYLGWSMLLLTILCAIFFRDPNRIAPDNEKAILSAADGTITSIIRMRPPAELKLATTEEMIRVSTFLSIFNVHVNRIPVTGKVITMNYHPGKFISATLDKSSVDNERLSLVIETKNKDHIAVVQIAGLIARRIVCNVTLGQTVQQNERFGIIRFGSRVDIYFPQSYKVLVKVGQSMIGGETVIAENVSE